MNPGARFHKGGRIWASYLLRLQLGPETYIPLCNSGLGMSVISLLAYSLIAEQRKKPSLGGGDLAYKLTPLH